MMLFREKELLFNIYSTTVTVFLYFWFKGIKKIYEAII